MKKLALLAISLLFSLTVLEAASKDDHPCKQMAEGASGSSNSKVLFDVVTLAAFLKLGMPEGIVISYFPFLHDLAEYEVNALRAEAESLDMSQQQALTVVSALNNGWYIQAAMTAILGGGYFFYGNLDEAASIRAVLRTALATYTISQLAAAGVARYARTKNANNDSLEYVS